MVTGRWGEEGVYSPEASTFVYLTPAHYRLLNLLRQRDKSQSKKRLREGVNKSIALWGRELGYIATLDHRHGASGGGLLFFLQVLMDIG